MHLELRSTFTYSHCGYHRYLTKLYVGSVLVSAKYDRSSELGLYLWGNQPLPTVQEPPPFVSGGWLPHGG